MTKAILELANIARRQCGLFTLSQAKQLGFKKNNSTYYQKTGKWKKVTKGSSGIYEFCGLDLDYIEENHRQIWHAYLWAFDSSGKPGAIISHESALYIHDLSDLLPNKVHITPIQEGRFRRRSMPPTEIEIHKSEVTDADYEEMESGLLVMTPIAALRNLLKEDRQSWEHIEGGFRDAVEKGKITLGELSRLPGYEETHKKLIHSWFPEYFKLGKEV
jgi:hypothetical protein